MEIKKIKRGDRLQLALTDLNVGESVKVPYWKTQARMTP